MSAIVNDNPSDMADMRLGTEVLRLTLAYEKLIRQGTSRTEAAPRLSRQNRNFSPSFFQALVELDPNAEEGGLQTYRFEQLSEGMIIQQDVFSTGVALLVSKGQTVTAPLLAKIKNLLARRVLTGEVTCSAPASTLAFVKGAS